ncbi:AMP-binding protein [Celerinatantimonas yamalensis]|uniref:AMP-binding protein n=1 Tax=Celerinatantimonas yamalensis TaxID=559956 RepID=A0ABW9GAP8_9GAMM
MNLIEKMATHQGEALWYQGRSISYATLLVQARQQLLRWGNTRQLIVLRAYHHPNSIVIYLAALLGQHPLILLNPKLDTRTQRAIISRYQPNWCYLNGQIQGEHSYSKAHSLDPDLALLLTTSGSTGGVKLVQLSLANLSTNAQSITDYLHMDAQSRVLSALPLAYSYGLSLLNSHLWAGGSMVLDEPDPLNRTFWQLLSEQRVTQLAGVPYSYQIYEQLRMRRSEWPHLQVLTQAGGKIAPNLAEKFANWASLQGKEFYVMYGQTEATARIAYLPATQVLARPDSIGVAIPGGELGIVDEREQSLPANSVGELVYRGPNVMLGYAKELSDLDHPSRPQLLKTGDLGYCDSEGFYYITGRLKRMIKLAGVRTGLDSLESALAAQGIPSTCCGHDDALRIALNSAKQLSRVADYLHDELALHPSLFKLAVISEQPHSANGKLDYCQLETLIEQSDQVNFSDE